MEETGDCPFRKGRRNKRKAKGAPAATGRRSSGPRTLGRSGAPASSTHRPAKPHSSQVRRQTLGRSPGGGVPTATMIPGRPRGPRDPVQDAQAYMRTHKVPELFRVRPPPPAPRPRPGGPPRCRRVGRTACRGQAPSPEPTPGGAVGGWGGAGPRRPRWVPRGPAPAPARPGPARPAREGGLLQRQGGATTTTWSVAQEGGTTTPTRPFHLFPPPRKLSASGSRG